LSALRRWWRSTLGGAPLSLVLLGFGAAGLIGYELYIAIDSSVVRQVYRRGDVYVCDLRSLSGFDLDQVRGRTEDIPKEDRDLDGKRVALVGLMWSPYNVDGRVRHFDLCYSFGGCCFAGTPKVQHFVKASAGDGVRPISGRVEVTGVLHVGVQRNGDGIESVYRLDVESVRPR
jgi:hypothetical protein